VLASGSSGNCSVLVHQPVCGERRIWLIDAGLSPKRTRGLLACADISLDEIEGVFLTHLDSDHWNLNWGRGLPGHIVVRLHESHAREFARLGDRPAMPFDHPIRLGEDVEVSPLLAAHDDSGAAVFRFHFPSGSLGFATDLGRPTPSLIAHLRSVDVLAIESNYCPQLQRASPRPAFLKQRIMGGSGHLSNQQSAAMVRSIAPRTHVVLLHLSRPCNVPTLAAREHHEASYKLTITSQDAPTPWLAIEGPAPGDMPVSECQTLFDSAVAAPARPQRAAAGTRAP
jgi:phosphoribosyl 1,2-cyclic phosphodiesterase